MNFGFYMPGQIIDGESCVRENASALALGTHALIVRKKNSAWADARSCRKLYFATAFRKTQGSNCHEKKY